MLLQVFLQSSTARSICVRFQGCALHHVSVAGSNGASKLLVEERYGDWIRQMQAVRNLRWQVSRNRKSVQWRPLPITESPTLGKVREEPRLAERTRRKYASSVLVMLRPSCSAAAASGADTKSSQPHTRLAICAKPADVQPAHQQACGSVLGTGN